LIDDPYYKSQRGVAGHLLGGWSIAPVFAYGSGAPVYCNTNTDAQAFGSADGRNFFTNEQCIFTKQPPYGSTLHEVSGGGEFNMFADPAAVFATARDPILGLDKGTGGVGQIRGFGYWNMDVRVTKNIKVYERVGFDFQFVTTNLFNHPVFYNGGLDLTAGVANFGLTGSQGNNPRQMQFGIRLSF